MARVVALKHDEGVRLDAACLVGLVTRMGDRCAEQVVAESLDEMALCLARMELHYGEGEMSAICRRTRKLGRLASEVGMVSLSRVAEDVGACAARGDMVAFAATWSRLQRIADRSLGAIFALRGSAM